jgi:hypothetical protein
MDILLKNGYKNDGYIYCIDPKIMVNGKSVVKIGKISMKMEETEIDVENKLASRYGTYYPDYDLLYFERVTDCHLAEKELFRILSDTRHKKEMFYMDIEKIRLGFDLIKRKYPDIDSYIINLELSDLNIINNEIRVMEIEEEVKF